MHLEVICGDLFESIAVWFSTVNIRNSKEAKIFCIIDAKH
jgi:hypothetical protein